MFNKSRPNTGVDNAILHKNVILSCGEDASELLAAVNLTGVQNSKEHHDYRCYRFWKYSQFTLVWTGIGTGCLEPLLYEILLESPIEKICLIGTAGMSRQREGLVKGQIYYLSEARTLAAGVRPIDFKSPLRPRWNSQQMSIPEATILSTDYYYGLSRIVNPLLQKVRMLDCALSEDYSKELDKVDLVDMEVAQFYFLCYALGNKQLQWAALKGPANSLDDFSEQSDNSQNILVNATRKALALMQIKSP